MGTVMFADPLAPVKALGELEEWMDAHGVQSVRELSGAVEGLSMTTVYIIRHAEAEGNVYRRCHGQYDSLLTPPRV